MDGWRWRRGVLGLLLVAIVATGCASQPGPNDGAVPDPLVRQTTAGPVRGVGESESLHFRGIPFAAAPVGALRWKEPRPLALRTDPLDATAFGPVCMQRQRSEPMLMSEDCLTLNVSIPQGAAPGGALPVLVRIHGGGFVSGSGPSGHAADIWNSEGVVLVTMNYRLGALGVFDHPLLRQEAGDAPYAVNLALLDVKAALEWVQDNIAAFGGDPDRVTITGVSAGGEVVDLLLVMPGVKGLFARAIASSGYASWPMPVSAAIVDGELDGGRNAESISTAIARRAMDGADASSVEELRALDAVALVAAIDGFHLPVIDGVTLRDDPIKLFAQEEAVRVPFMTGGNSYEGSVFPASGVSVERMREILGESWDRLRALYADDFSVSEELGTTRMFGDMRYVLASVLIGTEMSKRSPTYLYYVSYVPPARRNTLAGAPHGGETPLLERGGPEGPGPDMRAYWANFIRTGDPNDSELASWPSSRDGELRWMVFGDAVGQSDVIPDRLQALTAARAQSSWSGSDPKLKPSASR